MSKMKHKQMVSVGFDIIPLRTDFSLVRNLYLYADEHFEGNVELLTDRIVSEYIKTNSDNRRLTTYIGYSAEYTYNLRVKVETKSNLDDFCEKFCKKTNRSEVVKAALYQWELQLRDRYEWNSEVKKGDGPRLPKEAV